MVLPLDVLENSLDSVFQLTLKDGRVVSGKLVGFDQHMNLVLEDAKETGAGDDRALGTVIVRGNNIVSLGRP